jgi:membrane fusion protein (multidrug efflux system)
MRRYVKWLLVGGIAVLLAGGFLLYRYFAGYETTDDAQIDVHLSSISARVSGHVVKVHAGDNDYVQEGALLIELDPMDYQVAVDKARADLANSEATAQSLSLGIPVTSANTSSQLASSAADVQSAEAGILAAQHGVAAARAQVQEAEANDVKAQADLQRYALLVDKQEVSAQVYAQALAAARASSAAVAGARANHAAAEQAVAQAMERRTQAEANHRGAQTAPQQVASTRARARAAAADVQQKRAALEQALLNLRYTRIVAPTSGQVMKNVVVGMNVQPGQQLLTIIPLDEVWVTANFKETQLRRIRPGQRVDIDVDSSGRIYRGRIDSVAGATGPIFSLFPPENATGNYVKIVQRIPVKIVLEPGQNHDRQLRPGMSVVPTVYLDERG